MEQEIDLMAYAKVLKSGWKIIFSITLVAMITSAILSFYIIKPTYETTATILVQQQKEDKTNSEYNSLLANKEWIKTYTQIALSRRVLENVKKQANLSIPVEDLEGKLTVKPLGDSQILNISVADNNPQKATEIANAASANFIEEARKITGLDNVKIIDSAAVPEEPIKPKKFINILLAGILGILSSIGIVLVRDYLDNTIKNPEEVETNFNLPVLGIIPEIKDIQSNKLASSHERKILNNEYAC